MHVFYIDATDEQNTFLCEEESYHCIKVLRFQEKDIIYLIDGKGGFYHATITQASAKKCAVRVDEKKQSPPSLHTIHIAICPPKSSDRLEFFVEKAVEIGVDKISFIISQRSERNKINKERLDKIVYAASKQAMRLFFPVLVESISFEKFIKQDTTTEKYIAHCCPTISKTFLGKCISIHEDIVILIGPEGDFTNEEIHQACALNYQSVSLGNYRLRTETAALVASNICQLMREINK